MSHHWFNPRCPPPPLPNSQMYHSQAYYNTWNSPVPYSVPTSFTVPPPNFNQPPPPMHNPIFRYDYGYVHGYAGAAAGSGYAGGSLNYAEELESYRSTKASYDKAQGKERGESENERSRRSYSRETRYRRVR